MPSAKGVPAGESTLNDRDVGLRVEGSAHVRAFLQLHGVRVGIARRQDAARAESERLAFVDVGERDARAAVVRLTGIAREVDLAAIRTEAIAVIVCGIAARLAHVRGSLCDTGVGAASGEASGAA